MNERFAGLAEKLSLLKQPIIILDLEATGGDLTHDRITEIAYLRIEGKNIQAIQYLVNPERDISPFISQLTGIDNDLVNNAPVFADLAQKLLSDLQGCILIAHNTAFDYNLLNHEFQRLGMPFGMSALCTVRLSKILYPNEKKHNLDSIAERFSITPNGRRHRAMTDVEMLAEFLQKALENQKTTWLHTIHVLSNPPILPTNFPDQLRPELYQLSDRPGVVICSLQDGKIDIHICTRAYSETTRHLIDHPYLYNNITALNFIPAAGTMHALSEKAHYLYRIGNITEQYTKRFTVLFQNNEQGCLQAQIIPLKSGFHTKAPYGAFHHPKAAQRALSEWAQKHKIPHKQQINTDCPTYQIDNLNKHYSSIQAALPYFACNGDAATRRIQITETDPFTDEQHSFICEHGALQLSKNLWYVDPLITDIIHHKLKHARHTIRELHTTSSLQHALSILTNRFQSTS